MTFDTAFKHLYAKELAPYGFQKIKGRRPYFVRMIGEEIVHVISYQNDWAFRPYKRFTVLWGVATVYRNKINFEKNPRDTIKWTTYVRDETGSPRFEYRDASPMKPGVTYETGGHDVDMMVELQRSVEVVIHNTLPIMDKMITLYDCIKNPHPNTILYENALERVHDEDNEGLLNIKVFDLKEFEEIQRMLVEKTDSEHKAIAVKDMNEEVDTFRKYTQDKEYYQKVMNELERRKRENQAILRSYGIEFNKTN